MCACMCVCVHVPYTYKVYNFLRDVIFEVCAVNWPSAKYLSLKFHWQNLIVISVTDSTFLRLGDSQNLHTLKICTYTVCVCVCVCAYVCEITLWYYNTASLPQQQQTFKQCCSDQMLRNKQIFKHCPSLATHG